MNETKLNELLASGPSLSREKNWREIDAALRGDGLPGITAKMEIGGHDLYLETAWYKGRIVRIDITLSRGKDITDDLPKSEQMVSMEITRFDLARSWVENECRMASNLLQTGKAGIDTILSEWSGVSGYPSGFCPQIKGVNPETGEVGPTFQRGPLHAAAMLLRARLVEWTEIMKDIS
jgi:hypothetical protein